jgi:hypothetical protein
MSHQDLHKQIDTTQYEGVYGTMPSGKAFWIFENEKGELYELNADYSSARKVARIRFKGSAKISLIARR